MSGTTEWGCRVPDAMADDPPAWKSFWKGAAEMDGWVPSGEPMLTRHDRTTINGASLFPGEPTVMYVAKGPVVRHSR